MTKLTIRLKFLAPKFICYLLLY